MVDLSRRPLQFKDNRIYAHFVEVPHHEKLVEFVAWFLGVFGEAVITSAHRSRKIHSADSGIHMTDPLRAVDLRYYIYSAPEAVRDYTNLVWTYDPSRPHLQVCLLHNTGRGRHFHIQVHDRTVKI